MMIVHNIKILKDNKQVEIIKDPDHVKETKKETGMIKKIIIGQEIDIVTEKGVEVIKTEPEKGLGVTEIEVEMTKIESGILKNLVEIRI